MFKKRLILAGGGHVHLPVLARLADFRAAGIDILCIAPGPYLAYSGMGPGLLTGRYTLPEVRFPIAARLARPGGTFVRGTVSAIDPAARRLFLRDGRHFSYDAVSFGIGSRVVPDFPVASTPGLPGATVYPVKPIENLLLARQELLARTAAGETARVLVVGGGAAGFEVAAGVLGLAAAAGLDRTTVAVAAPRGLLPGWPERAVELAGESLARRGATVIPARVVGLCGQTAQFSDATARPCDIVFVATGTQPPGLFTNCGLSVGPGGGLTVSACLQSPFHPEIFGGGDCIHFGPTPLPRAGVYAVRQGPVLARNLLAFLTGDRLRPFCDTDRNFLALLNCGDGRAILRKGPFVAEGAWAMGLKDWIDRRFMRSFPLRPSSRSPGPDTGGPRGSAHPPR
ncbi:NAD(P)/FAD-dependent oxidoreductase [Desulfovibrio sp. TomC]|uniref:NAD(P)/FAD-dependent oxidoreductase n=1 Tax=Desulfovibrio sp. TomC TaxID=1562888 RepID=UPI0005B7EA0B|nr:FAD-dependent oxidoreductase [Desulfovibrio sp. TomC]